MGGWIIAQIWKTDDMEAADAIENPGHGSVGSELRPNLAVSSDLGPGIRDDEILIDFSTTDASIAHVRIALENNYGIGLNAIWEMMKTAARFLGRGYDVEIIGFHAGNKPDVPSGKGTTIARIIANEEGDDIDDVIRNGRDATGSDSRRRNPVNASTIRTRLSWTRTVPGPCRCRQVRSGRFRRNRPRNRCRRGQTGPLSGRRRS